MRRRHLPVRWEINALINSDRAGGWLGKESNANFRSPALNMRTTQCGAANKAPSGLLEHLRIDGFVLAVLSDRSGDRSAHLRVQLRIADRLFVFERQLDAIDI